MTFPLTPVKNRGVGGRGVKILSVIIFFQVEMRKKRKKNESLSAI